MFRYLREQTGSPRSGSSPGSPHGRHRDRRSRDHRRSGASYDSPGVVHSPSSPMYRNGASSGASSPAAVYAEPIVVGARVLFEGNTQYPMFTGVVRFAGETKFSKGVWYGIEVDKMGIGKNDGSVRGKRYFTCRKTGDTYGLFVRAKRLAVLGYAEEYEDEPLGGGDDDEFDDDEFDDDLARALGLRDHADEDESLGTGSPSPRGSPVRATSADARPGSASERRRSRRGRDREAKRSSKRSSKKRSSRKPRLSSTKKKKNKRHSRRSHKGDRAGVSPTKSVTFVEPGEDRDGSPARDELMLRPRGSKRRSRRSARGSGGIARHPRVQSREQARLRGDGDDSLECKSCSLLLLGLV